MVFSPSKIIKHLGLKINDPKSICYQAAVNDLPIFCPAFTDGFIGECLYEYGLENPGFILDAADDIFHMNNSCFGAKKTGVIILGGGIIKHHILNCNLMRNGCDYSVFINTGAEFEASDSGAKPYEALSWGKLRLTCEFTKVYSDIAVVLPVLVAGTFKKNEVLAARSQEYKDTPDDYRY